MKKIEIEISQENLLKALQNSETLNDGFLRIDLDVETVYEESNSPSPTKENAEMILNYRYWEDLVKKYQINLKDLREHILLANSWWEAKSTDPGAPEELLVKYHLVHKDESRDKVYSEELILLALSGISKSQNPVTDFYRRIKKLNPRDYQVFEEFYKALWS